MITTIILLLIAISLLIFVLVTFNTKKTINPKHDYVIGVDPYNESNIGKVEYFDGIEKIGEHIGKYGEEEIPEDYFNSLVFKDGKWQKP